MECQSSNINSCSLWYHSLIDNVNNRLEIWFLGYRAATPTVALIPYQRNLGDFVDFGRKRPHDSDSSDDDNYSNRNSNNNNNNANTSFGLPLQQNIKKEHV